MAAIRHTLGRLGRWVTGASFVSTLFGLPVAVALLGPPDDRVTVMAKPRNAVILTAPARVSSLVNLSMAGGVLHTGDGTPFATDRPIRRIEVESAAFMLDLSSTAQGPDEQPIASSDLARVLAQLSEFKMGTLALKRASLDIVLSDGARLKLTHLAGEVEASANDSFTAKGTARITGHPITFEASWNRPADAKRDAAYPLRLSIKGSLIDARFNGRMSFANGARLEGNAEVVTRKARALARILGLAVQPGEDLRNSRISGDMTWANGLLAFPKASVTIDGNEASGVLAMRTWGPRPKLEGSLAFSTFAVKPYLASLRDGLGRTTSETGVPARLKPLIATLDADIRLSAGKVVAPMLELGRAAMTVSIKDGRMRAELAEIEVEGGAADGIITIDMAAPTPRLGLKLRATKIDPGRMFADYLQRNPLIGRVNVTVDAAGSGHTMAELGMALAGKGTLHLVESGRLGIDLRALTNVVLKTEATGWSVAGRGNTPLTSLEARYQIVNGGLMFDSIAAQSGTTTYFGIGQVDVRGRAIDLNLAHASATASEVPVTLRDALRIHGPWSAPRFDPLSSPFRAPNPTQRGMLMHDVTSDVHKASTPSTSERGRASTTP